jgi:hypothetical protein
MMRKLAVSFSVSLAVFLALGFVAAPSAWSAEARTLTAADIAGMGGTDFKGGVGDLLLRNDKIEVVILAVTETPDFEIPVVSETLPGRGIIIDAGTRGDKNDQLGEIVHVANLGGNVLFYDGSSITSASGTTATIEVTGVVIFDGVSSPSPPSARTLVAKTTYSLTDGDSYVDITTEVTNLLPFPFPIFSIADVDITVSRGRLPFQPFPGRGNKPPPLDLTSPTSVFLALGVFNYLSAPGNNGPTDGLTNDDGSPSGEVSYTFVADSVFDPLMGAASGLLSLAGNVFDLAAVAGGTPPTIAPGGTLSHTRKFAISNRNSVESGLEIALPELFVPIYGFDARGSFSGRVVDGAGNPVPDAHIFFDSTTPGADPLLVTGLRTQFDENQDGIVDGEVFTMGGDPLPTSHVVTAADGTFSVQLQALLAGGAPSIPSVYEARIQAPERETFTVPGLVVSPANMLAIGGSTTDLGDIVLDDVGTLSFSVNDLGTGSTSPAKLTIIGDPGTDDPDFGSQYLSLRNFSGLSKNGGADGLDPVTEGNSSQLSEQLVGSPALNFHVDADGVGTLELKPGSYAVFASRGLEYSIDAKSVTIVAGATTNVSLDIERVVDTTGFVSADFHVHSAKSFDSSVPMSDRLVSFLAEGVDVLVSTDHSHVTDYGPLVASLGVSDEIATIVGEELTGGGPVPADATQGGIQAFPEGIGHWNAWPLTVYDTSRRNGAPQNEFVTPGTAIDRLRGMDSLAAIGKTPDSATIEDWITAINIGELTGDDEVVMLNHPRAGFAGLVVIGLLNGLNNPGGAPPGGYDPTLPITSAPNNLLFTPSLYNEAVIGPGGTTTTALSFDAIEIMNGSGAGAFLDVRDDWCSLLDQGIGKTGTAVSDSHRLVIENAGFARSFVASSTDDPASIDENELTQSVLDMELVGTSGPFIRFSIEDDSTNDVGLGGTAVSTGDKVTVKVRVEAAPWIPVEEVRIYRNCELVETRAIQSSKVLGKVLRFNRAIPLEGVDADSYFHIEAGIRLDANGDPVSPGLLGTVQTLEPGVEPFGFTNPIFVDRNGDGYVAPGLP